MERQIQIAVARADLIVCYASRVLAVTLMAVLLIALVWYAREALGGNPDVVPYDITSEGPEDGDPWYDGETWFRGGGV